MQLDNVIFVKVPAGFPNVGKDLAEIMHQSGLSKSTTQARRDIRAEGVKINDQRVKDPFARLAHDSTTGEWFLIESEKFS